MLERPSWSSGFARGADESEAPDQWVNVAGLYAPRLGIQGATLYDLSGYGNHGTLSGMAPATDWAPASNGEMALDFDKVDDCIILPTNFGHGATTGSPCTYLAWFTATGTANRQLVGRYNGTQLFQFGVAITTNAIRVSYGVTPFDAITGGASLNDGRVHMGAFTFSHLGAGALYVDGALVGSDAAVTGSFAAATALNIGRRGGDNAEPYSGKILDVRVYNRALTLAEIRAIHFDPLALYRLRLHRAWMSVVSTISGDRTNGISTAHGVAMIVSQYRQTGYTINDDRASGGALTEADIVTCMHCQKVLYISQWTIEGGWCGCCGAHICEPCAAKMDTDGCTPFLKLVDAALERQARDRAYKQALGL